VAGERLIDTCVCMRTYLCFSVEMVQRLLVNENAGNTISMKSSDNLQLAYKNALELAYTRARSHLRLASLTFLLCQVCVFSKPSRGRTVFPAFSFDREREIRYIA
jgi:hypothetical protein